MRPLSLELEGFLSWREPTRLDLDEIRAAAILGENGAGKTALVESISWALFGRGRGGPDAMVNEQTSRARVRFEFELAGQRYAVERWRDSGKSGKSYLGLFSAGDQPEESQPQPWSPIGGDAIRETQAAIESLLGMDADTWLATSFVAQGKADAFTALGPAERKALLFDLLELEWWAGLAERAREERRRIEATRGELLGAIRHLEPAAADLPDREEAARTAALALEEARAAAVKAAAALTMARTEVDRARARSAEIAEAARRREEAVRTAAAARDDLARADLAHARAVTAHDAVKTRIADLMLATGSRPALLERVGELEDALEQWRATLQSERDEAARAAAVAEGAGEASDRTASRAEALRGEEATCPVCGGPLPAAERERLVLEVEAELGLAESRRGRALAEVDRATASAQAAKTQIDSLEHDARAIAAHLEREAAVEAEIRAVSLSRDQTGSDVRTYAEELERRRAAHEAAESAIPAASPDDDDLRAYVHGAEDHAARAAGAADRAAEAVWAAVATSTRADEALSATRQAAESLRERVERLEVVELEAADLDVLGRAAGRDGIPALLLESELGGLEDEANGILGRLTAERLSLRLETLRALRGGGERETLEVLVGDAGGERRLESLSGGERQCVDLALRTALARVLAHRAGHPVETLIVDEGFTALDVAHKQRTIAILHGLLEEFGLVLFVTHLADMAEAFPTTIRVERDGSGSRLEVLSPPVDNSVDNGAAPR